MPDKAMITQKQQVRISDEITPSNEDRKVDESTQAAKGHIRCAYTIKHPHIPDSINNFKQPAHRQQLRLCQVSTSITSLTATASSQTGEWLYKTCTNDSWCHGQYDLNTLCVNNFCVCKPGFYYSTGGNTCVSTCLDKDVLNDVLDYPNHVIAFPLIPSMPPADSLDVCKDACYSNVRCRFFNYCKIFKVCFFFILTSTTVTWPSLQQSTNCSVYIRTCA
ncbi:uncharacterized protein LOC112566935 [Pomacea canaliculata]|uniref:uncharacterized protein LOC112566935 n=1 Tax=Pomacea canaliculata TaxID=400727 RepID=UPI000D73FAE9|nr:uncharacterized protein LOC112566935 [Pomacea canaliculata]